MKHYRRNTLRAQIYISYTLEQPKGVCVAFRRSHRKSARHASRDKCAENSPPKFKAVCKRWNRVIGHIGKNLLWICLDGLTMVTASWKCFSLEPTVRLCGMVNRQSCRLWVSKNPHVIPEYEDHSPNEIWYAPFLATR
jgi:hypothetical protein